MQQPPTAEGNPLPHGPATWLIGSGLVFIVLLVAYNMYVGNCLTKVSFFSLFTVEFAPCDTIAKAGVVDEFACASGTIWEYYQRTANAPAPSFHFELKHNCRGEIVATVKDAATSIAAGRLFQTDIQLALNQGIIVRGPAGPDAGRVKITFRKH